MILSILKNRLLFAHLPKYSFSSQPSRQSNQLNQQILQTKTWKDFYLLFSNRKNEFTPETFSLTNRYIYSLISRQRNSFSYSELTDIVATIEKFDVSTISETTAVSFLTLLRAFQNKGFFNKSFQKLKISLCNRYLEVLEGKPQNTQNASQLVYAYYQLAYFGWYIGTQVISERLLKTITKKVQGKSVLALPQMLYFLNGLSIKGDLSLSDLRLRTFILNNLVKNVGTLEFNDLLKSLISLNRMTFHDATNQQFSLVNTLGNKFLENIGQLDQRTIFQFLQGNHNSNHPIFYKINEEIVKNTFTLIEQNGSTQLDKKVIIKILANVSIRSNFNNLSKRQKKKFSNFLDSWASKINQSNNSEEARVFYSCLQDIIKNRYYEQAEMQKLINTKLKSIFYQRLQFLELVYNNKLDLTELLPGFLSTQFKEQLSSVTCLNQCSFTKRLIKNPKYQAYKGKLENYLTKFTKQVEQIFKTPASFTETFIKIFKNSEIYLNLKFFHDGSQEYFSKLPNPFQVPDPTFPSDYKVVYLQYVVNAFRPAPFYKFTNSYKIDHSVIAKVIEHHLALKTDKIQPNIYLVKLASNGLASAFQLKEQTFINATLELVNKYNSFIISNQAEHELTKSIIRMIKVYLQNMEQLKQIKSQKVFLRNFNRYLTRNSGNYKNDEAFRDLLFISFKHLDKMPVYMVTSIIKQALRLNILQKKHIENIDLSKWQSLKYQQFSLNYLKDPNFVPTITSITSANLQTIMFNPNLHILLQSKQKEVNEILQKANINELFSYLAANNQPNTVTTNNLISKILSLINSSEQTIQRCDFQGAISKLVEKKFNHMRECTSLAEKIINLLTNKMPNFSLWTHFEVIRFAITIPKYNPQKYYQKLLAYATRNYKDSDIEQLLYRLSFTNFKFKASDLSYVTSLLNKNTFKGIYLFLATQTQHEEARRKQIVAQITKKLKQAKENQTVIQNLQYQYLKKAYPEETKDLQLKPQQLQKDTMVYKPRPRTIGLLKFIAEKKQTTLETLPNPQGSYIAKINNFCFVFFSQRRLGSVYEQQFVKRALPLIFKEQEYIFIFIGAHKITSLATYIQKQAPQLITQDIKQAIAEYLHQNKAETVEAGEEDQNAAKSEKVEPKNKRDGKPKKIFKTEQPKTV